MPDHNPEDERLSPRNPVDAIGSLECLVEGRIGRLAEAPGTPVRITSISAETGLAEMEVLEHEEEGTIWEVPFEELDKFVFESASQAAADWDLLRYHTAVSRLDHPLEIEDDSEQYQKTLQQLRQTRQSIGVWLDEQPISMPMQTIAEAFADLEIVPAIFVLLNELMDRLDLIEIERSVAPRISLQPFEGESVRAHRIVMAEMGLAPYRGKMLRDPKVLQGSLSRARRKRHILARLAFVQEILIRLGYDRLVLYWGFSKEPSALNKPVALPDSTPDSIAAAIDLKLSRSFVSTTLSRLAAFRTFEGALRGSTGILYRQSVPIERVFMTYLETKELNRSGKQAAVLLLADHSNPLF